MENVYLSLIQQSVYKFNIWPSLNINSRVRYIINGEASINAAGSNPYVEYESSLKLLGQMYFIKEANLIFLMMY